MGIIEESINRKDLMAEKKKLQELLKKEKEIEHSLTVGTYSEDSWRELQCIRHKISITEAKIDGSFYNGEPVPQTLRMSNTNKYE